MMKTIDIKTWKRREHFEFLAKYDEPWFGIVSEVDCSRAYSTAKAQGHSFFAWYLHKSLLAVNGIDEFRYRIIDEQIVDYEEIHASSTIGRSDGTFAYSFIRFSPDFPTFNQALQEETAQVQNSTGLRLDPEAVRQDVIHYSSLPWKKFTGLTHARDFKTADSVPKITFGKAYSEGDKKLMAVSINAHHGLVDGLQAAQFLELFQNILDER